MIRKIHHFLFRDAYEMHVSAIVPAKVSRAITEPIPDDVGHEHLPPEVLVTQILLCQRIAWIIVGVQFSEVWYMTFECVQWRFCHTSIGGPDRGKQLTPPKSGQIEQPDYHR